MDSFRVHDLGHTHSFASIQWSGSSDQQMLLLTENCLQHQKRSFALKRREMAQAVLTKAFLQSAKTVTMCTVCYDYAHPPPPIPKFFKMIVSTDNMRPKLHDEYTSHVILIMYMEIIHEQLMRTCM